MAVWRAGERIRAGPFPRWASVGHPGVRDDLHAVERRCFWCCLKPPWADRLAPLASAI